MAGTATCIIVLVRLRKKIVVFTTSARNVVGVRTDDHTALTLRKLAHIDPDLLVFARAEVTDVQICLIASNSCVGINLLCLCFRSDCKLGPEAVIAARYARVCFHTIFYESEARRALIWYQWRLQRSHALALCASHFALVLKNVKCLWCALAE